MTFNDFLKLNKIKLTPLQDDAVNNFLKYTIEENNEVLRFFQMRVSGTSFVLRLLEDYYKNFYRK